MIFLISVSFRITTLFMTFFLFLSCQSPVKIFVLLQGVQVCKQKQQVLQTTGLKLGSPHTTNTTLLSSFSVQYTAKRHFP